MSPLHPPLPHTLIHPPLALTCSGAWKDASFKNYNFAAAGQLPEGGALHPLLKMREEMRQIFFDMGYVVFSS
jgi:phenylalanyl-tRNA synthetase alpha subunit